MNLAVKVIILADAFTLVKGSGRTCCRCHRDAVLFQEYSGRAFCREHLVRDIERRARREVRRQGGLRPDDRVGILPAEGPAAYALQAFLERRAVGGRVSVVQMSPVADGSPAVAAARMGCTVFADASPLEDAAAHILSAVLRGRPIDLLAPPPPGAARVIHPFSRVPAGEVRFYASWLGGVPCSSSGLETEPFVRFVSEELDRHTCRHPSAQFALVRLEDALLRLSQEERRCSTG